MEVDDRDPARLRMMPYFFLEGCLRLPAASADHGDSAVICGDGLVDVAADEQIRDSVDDKRISLGVWDVLGGGMCWGKVSPLQKKLHHKVCPIISSLVPKGIDFGDEMVERVSMVHKDIKP